MKRKACALRTTWTTGDDGGDSGGDGGGTKKRNAIRRDSADEEWR